MSASRGTNAIYRHAKYIKAAKLLPLLQTLPNMGVGARVKKITWLGNRYHEITHLKLDKQTGKIRQAFAIHYNKGVLIDPEPFMVTFTKRLIWRLVDKPVSAQWGESPEYMWKQKVLEDIKQDEKQRILQMMQPVQNALPEKSQDTD